jgi:hypothetical protein
MATSTLLAVRVLCGMGDHYIQHSLNKVAHVANCDRLVTVGIGSI